MAKTKVRRDEVLRARVKGRDLAWNALRYVVAVRSSKHHADPVWSELGVHDDPESAQRHIDRNVEMGCGTKEDHAIIKVWLIFAEA